MSNTQQPLTTDPKTNNAMDTSDKLSSDTLNIAIIFHSNFGHTKRVAQAIASGAKAYNNSHLKVDLIDTDDIEQHWDKADAADMIVFGSAVYMGSVTAEFKTFMDETSKRWFTRKWMGKWAAGFANSGGLSGDKLSALQQIQLFSMQHGMNWAGFPVMPTGHSQTDINRLSCFMGLMTQSENGPPEVTPCVGDIETAQLFGEHLAKVLISQPPVTIEQSATDLVD